MRKLKNTRLFDEYRIIRDYKKTVSKFEVAGSLSLYLKVRSCHHELGWSTDEFFQYKYDKLTAEERQDFISEVTHIKFAESVNSRSVIQILSDKWKTFEYYNKFFRREACLVTASNMGGV